MGFIRGALLVLVCVVLFLSLLCMGFFATLSSSLNYNVVQPQLNSVVKDVIIDEIDFIPTIEKNIGLVALYCVNNTEYVFKEDTTGYTFALPCDTLLQGPDAIVDYGVNYLIEEIYYTDYNCDFWDCFKETGTPLFLISKVAKDYWAGKFRLFLFFSLILLAIIFILAQSKSNAFVLGGALVVGSSLIISKIDSIGNLILNAILKPVTSELGLSSGLDLSLIISIFFTKSNSVFLTLFIIGLILIATGIVFKIFKIGFKINKIFNKNEKVIVKEVPIKVAVKSKKGETTIIKE